MEGRDATCEALYLLSKPVKGRARDALAEDAFTHIKVEVLLTPPGWGTGVVNVKFHFPHLESLADIGPRIKQRPKQEV